MLKIYLAGSWRYAESILCLLERLRNCNLNVDCFCDQEHGRIGFNIAQELHQAGQGVNDVDAITALQHPAVAEKFRIAFAEDKKWLDWANCLVMCMPCGNSAHLEAGYMKGKGGLLYIYWMQELPKGQFDNMYQFANGMYRPNEWNSLVATLQTGANKWL